MVSFLKKTSVKLSLVAAMAIMPSIVYAGSASGVMEGSSESSTAITEAPNFEGQLARINIGINLVRLNTDILERMPVSADSEWVNRVVEPITTEKYKSVLEMKEVKEDAYYSTVDITNAILGRPRTTISLLSVRLFSEAGAIYKNKTNGNENFNIPDMNVFPTISDTKSFVTFEDDKKVAVIDVEAKSGNLYKNVEEAVISMLPENLIEEIEASKKEYKQAREDAADAKSKVKTIEAWLNDDVNSGDPKIVDQKSNLTAANLELKDADAKFDAKEDAYYLLLKSGADAIAANFDEKKVPLAIKLQALLDTVDNNAVGALSMFVSATAGLYMGMGQASNETKAIAKAQESKSLNAKQKELLTDRYGRMIKGTVLAMPNIFLGSYYATKQASLAGKYQDIVNKVLEGAKAADEAKKVAAAKIAAK